MLCDRLIARRSVSELPNSETLEAVTKLGHTYAIFGSLKLPFTLVVSSLAASLLLYDQDGRRRVGSTAKCYRAVGILCLGLLDDDRRSFSMKSYIKV